MKPLLFPLLAATLIVCATAPARAFMMMCNEWKVDLTNEKEAKAKLEWSPADKLGITQAGLGFDGASNTSRDGWLQTEPIPVGVSWRPAPNVNLQVELSPAPKPVILPNGQTTTPCIGTAYARYSPDAKHWSTWQVLSRDDGKPGLRSFKGGLQVPGRERAAYGTLLAKYARLDVPWGSDEEAAVKWILKSQPDFFEHSLPFIGYVQILFEAPFGGGDRLQSLKIRSGCCIGGIARVPKDPKAQENRYGPWRFKAP